MALTINWVTMQQQWPSAGGLSTYQPTNAHDLWRILQTSLRSYGVCKTEFLGGNRSYPEEVYKLREEHAREDCWQPVEKPIEIHHQRPFSPVLVSAVTLSSDDFQRQPGLTMIRPNLHSVRVSEPTPLPQAMLTPAPLPPFNEAGARGELLAVLSAVPGAKVS